MEGEKHTYGSYESVKFEDRRESFYNYLQFLSKRDIPLSELLKHFPAYVGHMSLHRIFTLYELYKKSSECCRAYR